MSMSTFGISFYSLKCWIALREVVGWGLVGVRILNLYTLSLHREPPEIGIIKKLTAGSL